MKHASYSWMSSEELLREYEVQGVGDPLMDAIAGRLDEVDDLDKALDRAKDELDTVMDELDTVKDELDSVKSELDSVKDLLDEAERKNEV